VWSTGEPQFVQCSVIVVASAEGEGVGLLATAASIVVKAGLTLASPNRGFAYRVAVWSLALLGAATAVTVVVTA